MTALAAEPGPVRRAALLLGLALACSAAPAAADYQESYRRGIVEADRQAWSAVATYMRQAAAEQGKEGETVKIYGVRRVHYLPHFFLGLALAETGGCREALEQWQESESQGAVQGTPQYKSLLHRRRLCRLQLAGKSPSNPTGADAAAPAPAARDAAAGNPAGEEARQARGPETSRGPAVEARKGVDSQPGPPPELRAAARALFHADYEQVVRTLAGASFGERRARVTAALLLGAARYALFVQRGAKDDRLRRQALDDARTCRRLAPALRPDPAFFSPGFRELYRTAG